MRWQEPWLGKPSRGGLGSQRSLTGRSRQERPSGQPPNMFAPTAWPACFVDFLPANAVPNMPNRPRPLRMKRLFACLMDREASARRSSWRSSAEMPSLQEMHRLVADSPRSQAVFLLHMDALVDECLFGIRYESAGEGMGRPAPMAQEDNLASSGEPGLAVFVEDMLAPYESQGRGFQHGYRGGEPLMCFGMVTRRRSRSIWKSSRQQWWPAPSRTSTTAARRRRPSLVRDEVLTKKQRKMARLDGGLEIDGTRRVCLRESPPEPHGHVALEAMAARREGRDMRSTCRVVPLARAQPCLLPHYRSPQQGASFLPLTEAGLAASTPELVQLEATPRVAGVVLTN